MITYYTRNWSMSFYKIFFIVLFTQSLTAMNNNKEIIAINNNDKDRSLIKVGDFIIPQFMIDIYNKRAKNIECILNSSKEIQELHKKRLTIKMDMYWLNQDFNALKQETTKRSDTANALITLRESNQQPVSSENHTENTSTKKRKLEFVQKNTGDNSKNNKKDKPPVQENSTRPFVTVNCKNDSDNKPILICTVYKR